MQITTNQPMKTAINIISKHSHLIPFVCVCFTSTNGLIVMNRPAPYILILHYFNYKIGVFACKHNQENMSCCRKCRYYTTYSPFGNM